MAEIFSFFFEIVVHSVAYVTGKALVTFGTLGRIKTAFDDLETTDELLQGGSSRTVLFERDGQTYLRSDGAVGIGMLVWLIAGVLTWMSLRG